VPQLHYLGGQIQRRGSPSPPNHEFRDSSPKLESGNCERWGRERNWHALRLVSSQGSGSAPAQMTDEIKTRGIDLLSPVWNLLDITPDGRGQWDPKLTY
jgi:predicted dithiol-disulfide oxidoreductase (DUF899 family)